VRATRATGAAAWTLLASVVLTLLVPASPAAAQLTEADLLHRLDSLQPLLDAATRQSQEWQEEERARVRAQASLATDTLRVGLLRVIAAEGRSEQARDIVEAIWTEHYAAFVDRSPALESATFTFGLGDRRSFVLVPEATQELDVVRWLPRPRREEHVRGAVAAVLSRDLANALPLQSWVSESPFLPYRPEWTYRLVATTPSQAVRRCLSGALESCAAALGLEVEGDAALLSWYSEEERRYLVMRSDIGSVGDVRRRKCAEERRIDICDELLAADHRRWTPLPGTVRASLLRLALESGGQGAWGRLLEASERAPEEALAHVSGLDSRALLFEWRVRLVDGRPEAYAALGGRSLLALFWILFFATLAMRSTRWRSR